MNVIIDGKEYQVPNVKMRHVKALEEEGINCIGLITGKMTFTCAIALVMICTGCNSTVASDVVENHVINGFDLTELVVAFQKAMVESDFFKALLKKEEEKQSQPNVLKEVK